MARFKTARERLAILRKINAQRFKGGILNLRAFKHGYHCGRGGELQESVKEQPAYIAPAVFIPVWMRSMINSSTSTLGKLLPPSARMRRSQAKG